MGTLGGVYALRMLGLFIILPVFAIYAETLQNSTPMLAGIAVGIYGLTQAALQVPMGWLSDRFGRRAVVLLGLTIFMVGSLVAADATSIEQMIIGRALQGAGAISAALTAWVADLSREQVRARMMGMIGMLIGSTFIISLIAGPLLAGKIGVDGIFALVAGLAVLAMVMVLVLIPAGRVASQRAAGSWSAMREILRDSRLLRLSLGASIIHMLLTANFMSLPLAMRDLAGLPVEQHSMFYLVVLAGSALFLFPILRLAQPRVAGWMRTFALILVVSEVGLIFVRHEAMLLGGVLLVFFIVFNFLEAQLPAQVSRLCPVDLKGMALGVFSTAQFMGAFLGGLLAGLFLEGQNAEALYLTLAGIAVFWALLLNGLELSEERRI
ncbi:MAG: MFS transporter [Gammaproteobacteria bacterium]|nr:MFS transporter [Gammaproteobacteria bacterium]